MKYLTTLLFLGFYFVLNAQERIEATILDSLEIDSCSFFEKQKEIVFYNKSNVFYKTANEKTQNYNNFSLGNIEHIDLYNPLQIVLFYKDFNTIVLLDSQLNETHKIEGNKLESLINFDCVGLAIQNQIWFYDFISQKIGLYNFSTNTVQYKSTPLSQKIKDYTTDYNYFYWINENNISAVISIYGNIKTIGRLPEYDAIQILSSENYLIRKGNLLYLFKLEENKMHEIHISEKSFDKFYYKNGFLSIFTPNKVINYKILLP
ncbi:conserved exported hypothetical protein [Flavobacterium sp. 9AF]|uniref:hypothetical protein n=1 Tax=Flavobacterium sp. 9AF TaxID=2653142 RepID=UPI0012F33C78|nr:hypothetical protein [Flavobacterium sp. 9AF]VXB93333.1 conserved exported hypothetical protein [Flavobacterium sp. 9AF]